MTIDEITKMNRAQKDVGKPGIDYSSPLFYIAVGAVVFVAVNLMSKRRKK